MRELRVEGFGANLQAKEWEYMMDYSHHLQETVAGEEVGVTTLLESAGG